MVEYIAYCGGSSVDVLDISTTPQTFSWVSSFTGLMEETIEARGFKVSQL